MTAILLVDDDDDFRASLKDVLEDEGYDIVEACNGEQGLDDYRVLAPAIDLVISDALMPGCDGLEMLKILKRDYPSTKVIIVSGGGKIDKNVYLTLAKGLEADAVLKKPVSTQELFATINRVLPP